MKRRAKDELPGQPPKKKRKRYRKSKKNKLRYRSPNSYMIYRREFHNVCVKHNQDLKDKGETDVLKYKCVDEERKTNMTMVSKKSGANWRAFSEEEKKPYFDKATAQKKKNIQELKTSHESQQIPSPMEIRKCYEELQTIHRCITNIHQYLFAHERFNDSSTSEIRQPSKGKIRKKKRKSRKKRKPQSESESESVSSIERKSVSEIESEEDESILK